METQYKGVPRQRIKSDIFIEGPRTETPWEVCDCRHTSIYTVGTLNIHVNQSNQMQQLTTERCSPQNNPTNCYGEQQPPPSIF